jgi:hypothetical protein
MEMRINTEQQLQTANANFLGKREISYPPQRKFRLMICNRAQKYCLSQETLLSPPGWMDSRDTKPQAYLSAPQ